MFLKTSTAGKQQCYIRFVIMVKDRPYLARDASGSMASIIAHSGNDQSVCRAGNYSDAMSQFACVERVRCDTWHRTQGGAVYRKDLRVLLFWGYMTEDRVAQEHLANHQSHISDWE